MNWKDRVQNILLPSTATSSSRCSWHGSIWTPLTNSTALTRRFNLREISPTQQQHEQSNNINNFFENNAFSSTDAKLSSFLSEAISAVEKPEKAKWQNPMVIKTTTRSPFEDASQRKANLQEVSHQQKHLTIRLIKSGLWDLSTTP